jgi:DNA polymerase IV
MAPNKFLAKLASDHGKPDGFVVLRPEGGTAFLGSLPVARRWGVGDLLAFRIGRNEVHVAASLRRAAHEQEEKERNCRTPGYSEARSLHIP